MGIGNTGQPPWRDLPGRCSLPLMGIGNARRRAPRPDTSRSILSHYPSWGSETSRLQHAGRLRAPPSADFSLPLMGIGNPTCADVLTAAREKQRFTSSLPLMGIGNAGRRGVGIVAVPSGAPHYPSWGSETACAGYVDQRHAQQNSLPLMGIGNFVRARRIRPVPRTIPHLITPHGDRKRRGGSDSAYGQLFTYILITPHGDRKPWRR